MPPTLLSWEPTCWPFLCVGWWCTSRETAERPPRARSSRRAAPSTWPGAWTFSSVTSCRKCLGSWVSCRLVLRPLAAYLSVTRLSGIASFIFSLLCHCRWAQWHFVLNVLVSRFPCALSVFPVILHQWHDWGNELAEYDVGVSSVVNWWFGKINKRKAF